MERHMVYTTPRELISRGLWVRGGYFDLDAVRAGKLDPEDPMYLDINEVRKVFPGSLFRVVWYHHDFTAAWRK